MATIPPDYQIGLGSGRLSDDDARKHLEELLRLRQEFESGERVGPHTAFLAALEFAELVNGVMGWVAQTEHIQCSPEHYAMLSITQVQTLITATLRLGLPIMQAEARDALIEALDGLKAGYNSPLLQRTGRRRRAAPHRSAETEFKMLMWVHWQRGSGRKANKVEAELAEHACLEPTTIRKWPGELGKVYGVTRVREALKLAEAVGRAEASRQVQEDFCPLESERGHQLWVTSWTLERRLSQLVGQRKTAIGKRRVPR